MFISKMKLSRRTVLRGMGATLSLPLLEAMVPALTRGAEADYPLRRDLRAARQTSGLLGAEDRRQELRVQRRS